MKFLMCVFLAAVALSVVSAGYLRGGWNGGYGGGYGYSGLSGYGGWNNGWNGYSSPLVVSRGYGGWNNGWNNGYGGGWW